jgi:hypothetical protein
VQRVRAIRLWHADLAALPNVRDLERAGQQVPHKVDRHEAGLVSMCL